MAAIDAAEALGASTRRINWRSALEKTAVVTGCLGALAGAGMVIWVAVLISTSAPSYLTVQVLAGGGFFLLALVGAIAGVVELRMEPEPPEEQ